MNTQDKLLNYIDNSRWFFENSRDFILIKDTSFNYMECTPGLCDFFNMSKKSIVGGNDYNGPWESDAALYREHDQKVIAGNSLNTLEPLTDKKTILTVKALRHSIRDEGGKVIGIFAQALILPMNGVGETLSTVFQQDKKNTALSNCFPKTYRIENYNSDLKLTTREAECLFLLIRGKSAKEIARFLEISFRTVEGYLENIKYKMEVSSRSELIAKAIETGLIDIIPKKEIFMELSKNIKKWHDFLI